VPDTSSPALDVAMAYHKAWTSHDFDLAMTYIDEEIVCDAPAGCLEGTDAFRAFMGPFVQIVTATSLIAAFGDDKTAMLMYETETIPVKIAPGAECLTIRNGKIIHIRIVFDRAPFDAARTASRDT